MKRIYYSSGSVLTGDRIAEAVIEYAEVLALRDTSDTIDVPISLAGGGVGRAQLLIGPASQLVLVPAESEPDEDLPVEELEDPDTLAELDRRTALHSSPRPLANDDADTTDYDADESDYEDTDDSVRSSSEGTESWER
jgi:hypothetical protein